MDPFVISAAAFGAAILWLIATYRPAIVHFNFVDLRGPCAWLPRRYVNDAAFDDFGDIICVTSFLVAEEALDESLGMRLFT